jgi:hypothetical protein
VHPQAFFSHFLAFDPKQGATPIRTNAHEAVLSACMASIGKCAPRDAAQDAAELCNLANSLNRLNEIACNNGPTERQGWRKQNLQTGPRSNHKQHTLAGVPERQWHVG